MARDKFGKFTKIHGGSKTKLYFVWDSMMRRCYNPNHKAYHRYGKRGIIVDGLWHDFSMFKLWALDNGYKDNLSIDRIDNNLGYCPQNCQWVTIKENSQKDKVKKAVNQYDIEGNFVATYLSIEEAKRKTGIKHIGDVVRGSYGHKTAGGYVWEYA